MPSSRHELPDRPPEPSNKSEALKEAGFYVVAGAAGIGGAVNKVRESYYDQIKHIPEIEKLRAARQEKIVALEAAPPKGFRALHKARKKIHVDYTAEVNEVLHDKFHIHSKGLMGWTVGSGQRWMEVGPHPRAEAIFRLAEVSVVTLGALLMMNHARKQEHGAFHNEHDGSASR